MEETLGHLYFVGFTPFDRLGANGFSYINPHLRFRKDMPPSKSRMRESRAPRLQGPGAHAMELPPQL